MRPTGSGSDRLTKHETLLLYALFAGRCAKCQRPLVVESEASGRAYNLGKRAHVVGRSDDGPRGDAAIPPHERGDLTNHVLLCGTCHDEVDLDVAAWPVEALRAMRTKHLMWIESRLRSDDGADVASDVYARLMAQACALIWIDAWAQWTEHMLDPFRSWRPQQIDDVAEFVRAVATTDWPGTLPELEVALRRLAFLLSTAAQSFEARAEPQGSRLVAPRAYKRGFNPEYHRDAEAFERWLRDYESTIVEATMAAEWARDVWRRAGNPLFMLGQRVHIVTSFNSDLTNRIHLPAYSSDQIAKLRAAPAVEALAVIPLEYGEVEDGLNRLVRDVLDAAGARTDDDVVGHIEDRLRGAPASFDSSHLFEGIPGRCRTSRRGSGLRTTSCVMASLCVIRTPEDS